MRTKVLDNISSVYSYVGIAVYKLILELVYLWFINPIYENGGHTVDFNYKKYILSWGFLLIIAWLLPKSKDKVSFMILQLHAITMIIPILSIYGIGNHSSNFMLMVMICFVLEIVVIRLINNNLNLPKMKKKFKLAKIINKFNLPRITNNLHLPKIPNSRNLLLTLFFICTAVTYSTLLLFNGIHLEAIDFSKVYDIRKNLVYPFVFLEYLTSWQYRIINPYMIISSFALKKKRLFYVFLGLQVSLYFIIPYKEIILSVFLILGLCLFLQKYNFLKSIMYGIKLSIVVSVLLYLLKVSVMPLAIIPTRLLFEPAIIKFQHYEVFSKHLDKLFYSEGLIGQILGLTYPYDVPTGYVVNSYFGMGNSNSSTGYLAYAFDNLGFAGMIIMTFILILILWLIDLLSRGLNKNFVFAFLIYPFYMLNDGDLLTLLLTGGIFLSLIILLLDQESFKAEKIKINRFHNIAFGNWRNSP
ncbi:hypothetical protein [Bacillus sp. FJAT-27245]|uniref:hypothetical protein n=1 Tax=Bacillus sp. FJAT-27245 TaxID=1684144 RepID=UPI0006A7E02E|nr:hypothetical protein [Bacillus sp. FJAT-27245]